MAVNVVAQALGRARLTTRSAARTSFKRYAKTVQKLGRDILEPVVSSARVRRVSHNLLRGPAPATEAGYLSLVRQHHVKTIVTLLDPTNPKEIGLIQLERKAARKLGIDLQHVSMPFGVAPPRESIRKFLSIVTDKAKGQIYVHCRLGRDRTGTMVALYRMAIEGKSSRSALAEMKHFGYNPVREPFLAYLGNFVKDFGKMDRQPRRASAVLGAGLRQALGL